MSNWFAMVRNFRFEFIPSESKLFSYSKIYFWTILNHVKPIRKSFWISCDSNQFESIRFNSNESELSSSSESIQNRIYLKWILNTNHSDVELIRNGSKFLIRIYSEWIRTIQLFQNIFLNHSQSCQTNPKKLLNIMRLKSVWIIPIQFEWIRTKFFIWINTKSDLSKMNSRYESFWSRINSEWFETIFRIRSD